MLYFLLISLGGAIFILVLLLIEFIGKLNEVIEVSDKINILLENDNSKDIASAKELGKAEGRCMAWIEFCGSCTYGKIVKDFREGKR